MHRNKAWLPLAVLLLLAPAALAAQEAREGDPYTLSVIDGFNDGLRAEWMDIRVGQIDFLTIRQSRATSRIDRRPFRWVPGDPRRQADGDRLTYLVDLADARPSSGLETSAVEAAIDRAMATWGAERCLAEVPVVKRASGADADLFDAYFGAGAHGDFRAADVVHAGWLGRSFFDSVGGEGAGAEVLALSVTFVFVGPDGEPTDVDQDGYLDTAHAEIYYNDSFAWSLSGQGPDVQSVALHEIGHGLGIGHAGPPPAAAMNPVYGGIRHELLPLDGAAACTIWASWPN